EELLEVLESGMEDDQGIAEHVLLRGLQRLHEHEVDRKQAVHHRQPGQGPVPEPPTRSPPHAGSRSGASKSRKSTRSAARSKGTSSSERAEAGPNCPAPIASQ